jgi:hypothetical protein
VIIHSEHAVDITSRWLNLCLNRIQFCKPCFFVGGVKIDIHIRFLFVAGFWVATATGMFITNTIASIYIFCFLDWEKEAKRVSECWQFRL